MIVNKKATLTVDDKGENFALRVPFHFNHLAQKAPNRRFVKGGAYWRLPGLRLNAEYIRHVLLPTGLVAADEKALALVERVLERCAIRNVPFPAWYRFKEGVEPRAKQVEALDAAWGKPHMFFAMEMGTGKSKVYVDLTTALAMSGEIDAVVFLTKSSVCRNLEREIYKHCPLPDIKTLAPEFSSTGRVREAERFRDEKAPLKFVVAGLESMSGGLNSGQAFNYLWSFMMKHRCALVVDEAHLIKNPDSNRTKNATALGGLAGYRFAGTGTPVLQGFLDLYSQFGFLSPDIFGIGDFYSFKNRYTMKGGYENREVVGYDNVDELLALVKPWTFQVTKAEMMDLPPKVYMDPVVVPMAREQRKLYDSLRKEKVAEITSLAGGQLELAVKTALEAYNLLHQVCAGFISYDAEDPMSGKKCRARKWVVEPKENPKHREMLSILEANPGKQFIIWTKHIFELLAVYDLLRKLAPTVKYHGNMTKDERDVADAAFREGRAMYMVINQETGGTGLTFINCSDTIYLSNSFKYVDRAQSEDRNHRFGTTKTVTYTDIVMERSIDGHVLRVLGQKRDLADYVREQLAAGQLPDILSGD